MLPLIFGGKVYNSLKVLMTFKIVVVLGFLLFLAIFYSQPATWIEIFTGFFKFGTVPVERAKTSTATACSTRARTGTATAIWTSSSRG